MKFTILLVLAINLATYAGTYGQAKVSLKVKEVKLEEVLQKISSETGYFLLFSEEDIRNTQKAVSIDVSNANIEEVLDLCLKNTGLKYIINDETVIISSADIVEEVISETEQEAIEIKGKITDAEGMPLPGATIMEKGTLNGATSDANGNFTLKVKSKASIIQFSYIGFESQEITVGSKVLINVILKPSASSLDEVVVIGYGTSKVKDVTGSIARVGEKELKMAPMGASVESVLQGRAAGVNIAIQSASPTSPISVIIRGASSLTGDNQPLWVIDGVPEYSASTSGNIANTLYNLNLNDVLSIDILKDASATALYGSRAANGVVLVTTKKGVEGMDPTIQISSRIGIQQMDFNGFEYFEADEYIDFATKALREEVFGYGRFDYFTRIYGDQTAFRNLNTSEFSREDILVKDGAFYEGNTNWTKEMTQNPLVHQQDISLRGGTKKIAYFLSMNHNKMEGIVKSGQSELFGGRLNLEAKVRKDIKMGVNINGSYRKTDDKDYMLNVLKKVRPDIPAFNDDGTIFTRDPYTENPYTTLRNTQQGKGRTFSATGYLEYTIIEGLLLKTSYTTNYTSSQSLTYKRRGSTFNYSGKRNWSLGESSTNVWENTLTYAKTIGDHDILGLAGYSMEKNSYIRYSMEASNFPDDDILNNFPSGAERGSLGESYSAHSLISQFARVHYKYKNRYIISGTLRRDGSSRFGPDKRWGIFPSGAVAWLITEEDFMKTGNVKNWVSYLKLRASIGKAGSQNLGNYSWRTGVSSARYNETPGIVPSTLGNSELRWEETIMTDIGIDFGLWDERIRGSFGIYQKKTNDLIYNTPVPPSTSFSSISSNVASLKNNGVEFEVKVDILKKNDMLLTLDFNAARNTNKVVKINGSLEELLFPSSWSPYMKVEEGGKTNQWFGYQTANRLFVTQEEIIALQTVTETGGKQTYRDSRENPGDILFIDQDGDSKITDEDKVYLGSAEPKLFGGFGATFQRKGLMVNATFTYAFGHKRLWKMPMDDAGYVGNYNHAVQIAGNSATLKDPYEATIPRLTFYGWGRNNTFSDFWLHDASYLRLSSLNISYRLPNRLFENMIIDAIEVSFQATNLFTITSYPGFDPQGNWSSSSIGTGMGVDNSTYPSSKVFNFGIKMTFK